MDLELNWRTREDLGKGFEKLLEVLESIADSLEVVADGIGKKVEVSDEEIAELYTIAAEMRASNSERDRKLPRAANMAKEEFE